jgi:hypothetical protein
MRVLALAATLVGCLVTGAGSAAASGTGDIGSVTADAISAGEGAGFSGEVATFQVNCVPSVAMFIQCPPTSQFSAAIDWGDGVVSAGTVGSSNSCAGMLGYTTTCGYSASGTHAYAEGGARSTVVTITETGGGSFTAGSASANGSAAVADPPITASGRSFNVAPAASFTGMVAGFTDADPSTSPVEYSATIDWGDGASATAGTVSQNPAGGFDVGGTHTYATRGTYQVRASIRDAGGAAATTSAAATVANDADTFKGAGLVRGTSVVTGGAATVSLSCPAVTPGACGGTVVLTANAPARKVVFASRKRKRRQKRPLVLGTAPFSLSPGAKGVVKVKLSKAALRLVAKRKSIKAFVKVTATDAAGTVKTTRGSITLKRGRRH